MESIEFEKDLIAVLLVVESVHDKNKLLYKYEQANTDERRVDPISFHSPYAIVIAKDFDPPSAKDDDLPRTTFRNFDETTLSILTSPNSCGTHVAVQVDDVVFGGHTLGLENNKNLKSFAIFFALRAIAKAPIILSYQEMSKRIGTAIRCEEQRTSYLNQEYAKLISVLQQHDVDAGDPLVRTQNEERDRSREKVYATMVEHSPLAAILKQIYLDLQASGEINITVNNWLNVSCCLPHRSIAMNCSLPIDVALKALFDAETHFRPYHGLLLVIDPATLLASLPTDSSSTLNTLVRHLRPSYSMSRLSMETGVPLSQIYRLAAHLLFWGRAKIIFPVHDDNIYIISSDADISKHGSLSRLYKETFQNTPNYPTLQEALAEYSDAVALYDHIARHDESEMRERLQCIEWLLRHRLIVQVHYYYYLLLLNDDSNDFKDEYKRTRLPRARTNFVRLLSELLPLASSPLNSTLSHSSAYTSKSTETLRTATGTSQDDVFAPASLASNATTHNNRLSLHYLPQIAHALPNKLPSFHECLAMAMKDAKEQHAADFFRIIKYLDGTHHLEEIATLESLTRLQILTIIERFQSIVVRALHADPNPILQI